MTEIISWFCLMVIGFIGLFKLFTELYYHDHPKEYARMLWPPWALLQGRSRPLRQRKFNVLPAVS